MSNPSSVVNVTSPVVDSEGLASSPDDSNVSSDDMTKHSSVGQSSDATVDSDVLSPTISKVSSEDRTSTQERSTLSELEEMKAEMAAMQAKMKEQKETIIRLNSSSAQSQSSTAQEREFGMFDNSEFVNQLSTSAEKLNDHLSNKGKMFDAHLSVQAEKFAASLETTWRRCVNHMNMLIILKSKPCPRFLAWRLLSMSMEIESQ